MFTHFWIARLCAWYGYIGWTVWLLATVVLGFSCDAQGHGIVGNRVFPGTLAFDDPAVMDEVILAFSSLRRAEDEADVRDNQVDWAFSRLLTSTLAFEIDGGWLHRNWGPSQRFGADSTGIGLKALLYKNEIHETMISAGLSWGIGGSGSQVVGANSPNTIQPGLFFGRGFGDAPDNLSWMRPFAISGAVTLEHSLEGAVTNFGIDGASGQLLPTTTPTTDLLHWGVSLQYSTFYLTRRFSPGKLPKDEPLNQFIPLVEFAFDTPREGKTGATMNPGLAYVSEKWQILAEAIVPLNTDGGTSIGVRGGLFLFLDDIAPSVFGKPLLSR